MIAALLLALVSLSSADDTPTIHCPGTYDGHLQGIAVDPAGAIYWSFTVALVKTTADGTLLADTEVPTHHGDLWADDQHVYVAVNYRNEAKKRSSFLYAYHTEDLRLAWKKPIPEPVEGAGALAMRDGHFFVASGRRLKPFEHNLIFEYDTDAQLVATHTLASGPTYLGIQTMAWDGDTWWFGCYGQPPEILRADQDFTFEARFAYDCAMGIAPLPDGGFAVGRGNETADGKYTGSIEVIPHPAP